MKIIFPFLLIFSLASCGKSPFLKEPKNTVVKNTDLFETNIRNIDLQKKIEIKWLTEKKSYEESQALLFFYSNNKLYDPETSEDIHFYLWMESMGHGSSPIVVKKIDKGIYSLSEIFFTMPGDWQFKIDLKKSNQTIIFDYFLSE